MKRCECGRYYEGATRMLHRADRSGIAAVVDALHEARGLLSVGVPQEAAIVLDRAIAEVAEWFDMSEAPLNGEVKS